MYHWFIKLPHPYRCQCYRTKIWYIYMYIDVVKQMYWWYMNIFLWYFCLTPYNYNICYWEVAPNVKEMYIFSIYLTWWILAIPDAHIMHSFQAGQYPAWHANGVSVWRVKSSSVSHDENKNTMMLMNMFMNMFLFQHWNANSMLYIKKNCHAFVIWYKLGIYKFMKSYILCV